MRTLSWPGATARDTSDPDTVTGAPRPLPGVTLLLRRVRWLLVGAVAGLLLGLVGGLLRAPVYEATAYLSVHGDGLDQTSLVRDAQALARLATARNVVSDALNQAGLPGAARNPRLSITAEAAPDAPLISVSGLAGRPVDARSIAETVVAALGRVPLQGVHYSVEPAVLPTAATSPGWLPPAGGAALGFGLAVVLAASLPARRASSPGRGGASSSA